MKHILRSDPFPPTSVLTPLVVQAQEGNNSTGTPLTVEAFDNHVYFYSDVDSDRCLALMRELRRLDNFLRNERILRDVPADVPETPIWLHIYSGGGDALIGLAMADQIAALRTPVYSIVEGCCASAATFISMACAERFITPNSFMLIHEVRTFFYGTHSKLKDEEKLLEMWTEHAVSFYTSRSKLSEERIREMILHDWWMNSRETAENGFADAVLMGDTPNG